MDDDKSGVIATIYDTVTHETKDCREWAHTNANPEDVLRHWIEGNYACDCNRGNFFDGVFAEDRPCGYAPDGGNRYELKALSLFGVAILCPECDGKSLVECECDECNATGLAKNVGQQKGLD